MGSGERWMASWVPEEREGNRVEIENGQERENRLSSSLEWGVAAVEVEEMPNTVRRAALAYLIPT